MPLYVFGRILSLMTSTVDDTLPPYILCILLIHNSSMYFLDMCLLGPKPECYACRIGRFYSIYCRNLLSYLGNVVRGLSPFSIKFEISLIPLAQYLTVLYCSSLLLNLADISEVSLLADYQLGISLSSVPGAIGVSSGSNCC
jgi:hypothetical protein